MCSVLILTHEVSHALGPFQGMSVRSEAGVLFVNIAAPPLNLIQATYAKIGKILQESIWPLA